MENKEKISASPQVTDEQIVETMISIVERDGLDVRDEREDAVLQAAVIGTVRALLSAPPAAETLKCTYSWNCPKCGSDPCPEESAGWISAASQEAKPVAADSEWKRLGYKSEVDHLQVQLSAAKACIKAHEQVASAQEQPPADKRLATALDALKFYAEGQHFSLADADAWDTVSGEPGNFQCDEAGTATVEDGSIAKLALQEIAGESSSYSEMMALADAEQSQPQQVTK